MPVQLVVAYRGPLQPGYSPQRSTQWSGGVEPVSFEWDGVLCPSNLPSHRTAANDRLRGLNGHAAGPILGARSRAVAQMPRAKVVPGNLMFESKFILT